MKIKVNDEIFSKYGDIKVGIVRVEEFKITDEFKSKIEIKTKEAIELFNKLVSNKDISNIESVKNWREIYTKMGCSSSRVSSIENLYNIINERKALPDINPIVNYYNSISCISGIPMGAYDTTKTSGNLTLREASKGESFTPMCLNQIEKTKNGEIIYSDDEKVTCRYWNNKDSDKTKIDDKTTEVIFFFDVSPGISKDYLNETIISFVNELTDSKVSNKITYKIINKECKTVEI